MHLWRAQMCAASSLRAHAAISTASVTKWTSTAHKAKRALGLLGTQSPRLSSSLAQMQRQLAPSGGARQCASAIATPRPHARGPTQLAPRPTGAPPGLVTAMAPAASLQGQQQRSRGGLLVPRVSSVQQSLDNSNAAGVTVQLDNAADPTYTVLTLKGPNRAGCLSALTSAFRDFGARARSRRPEGAADHFARRAGDAARRAGRRKAGICKLGRARACMMRAGLDVGKATIDGDDATINDTFFLRTGAGAKITDPNVQAALTTTLQLLMDAGALQDAAPRPKFGTPDNKGTTNTGALLGAHAHTAHQLGN